MSWPSRAWAFVWDRVFSCSKVHPAEAARDRDQLPVIAQPSGILKHGTKQNSTEQLVSSLKIGSQVRLLTRGSAQTPHQESLSPEDFDDRESSRVMRTKSNFWSGVRMNPTSTRNSLTGETALRPHGPGSDDDVGSTPWPPRLKHIKRGCMEPPACHAVMQQASDSTK